MNDDTVKTIAHWIPATREQVAEGEHLRRMIWDPEYRAQKVAEAQEREVKRRASLTRWQCFREDNEPKVRSYFARFPWRIIRADELESLYDE